MGLSSLCFGLSKPFPRGFSRTRLTSRPVLRGKLLTGEESLQLRSEIAGGGGEGSASLDALWWPPHKISGRYLAPWLYHGEVHAEPEPPRRSIDVEVALPVEWHEEPLGFDS